jgi:hypothetical protein
LYLDVIERALPSAVAPSGEESAGIAVAVCIAGARQGPKCDDEDAFCCCVLFGTDMSVDWMDSFTPACNTAPVPRARRDLPIVTLPRPDEEEDDDDVY